MRVLEGAILFFAAGCGPSVFHTTRWHSGPTQPPPRDCSLRFVWADQAGLYPKGELLGYVFIRQADADWTNGMKHAVRPYACELGGEVASLTFAQRAGLRNLAAVEIYRLADSDQRQ